MKCFGKALRALLFIEAALSLLLVLCAQEPAKEKKKDDLSAPSRYVFSLEELEVNGKAPLPEKRDISSYTLQTHKIVDLSETLSDELITVQLIRKSGYGNEVSIRGFGQENLRFFLDGGIIEGACGSRKDPPLSHMAMLNVEAVEIEEGPFDVTKPSFMGGFVNVISKKPAEGLKGEALFKFGSFGFGSGGAVVSGGNKSAQYLLGYNYSKSGQYIDGDGRKLWRVRNGMPAPYNKDGENSDAFRKYDAWGKLSLTPNENNSVLVEYSYGRANDIMTPRVDFDTKREETKLSRASWELSDAGAASKKLRLTVYQNRIEHYPFQDYRSVAAPKNNVVLSIVTGGKIENVAETGFALFTYGMDLWRRFWWGDIFDSRTGHKLNTYFIPSVKTSNTALYIKGEKRYDKFEIDAGIRHERSRQEAEENIVFSKNRIGGIREKNNLTGGSLTFRYLIDEGSFIFAGIGRSHRMPTSVEQYIQAGPGFFGNTELKPAINNEFDLGTNIKADKLNLNARGFYSRLDDFIYQENNSAGFKSFTNIDAEMYGASAELKLECAGGFSVAAGAAYQRGKKLTYPDGNPDKDLGQIPPFKAKAALHYNRIFEEAGKWFSGTLEIVHANRSACVDSPAGEKQLDGSNVVNMRFGMSFKSWTWNIGVDNLFSEKYAAVNSYEWDVIGGAASTPAIVFEPKRFVFTSIKLSW